MPPLTEAQQTVRKMMSLGQRSYVDKLEKEPSGLKALGFGFFHLMDYEGHHRLIAPTGGGKWASYEQPARYGKFTVWSAYWEGTFPHEVLTIVTEV